MSDLIQLQDLLTQFYYVALKVKDIRQAHAEPPEKLSAFPCSLTFPLAGSISLESGFTEEEHTFVTEIHVARKNLGRDVEKLQPVLRDFAVAVANSNNLDWLVTAIRGMRYTFGELGYGTDKTFGWRIETDVSLTCPLSAPVWEADYQEDSTLRDVIGQVQRLAGGELRHAPIDPAEIINAYPASVAYARNGDFTIYQGWLKELHTVNLEIHVARKDLSRDARKVFAYWRSIPNALFNDPTLAGLAHTLNQVRYQFGALSYTPEGDVGSVGFRFNLNLKIDSKWR